MTGSSGSGFLRATTSLGCPFEAECLMYDIGMIKHEERNSTGCNQTDERHFVSRPRQSCFIIIEARALSSVDLRIVLPEFRTFGLWH